MSSIKSKFPGNGAYRWENHRVNAQWIDLALAGESLMRAQTLTHVNSNYRKQNCLSLGATLRPHVLPSELTALPGGEPSWKSSLVACKIAYASEGRDYIDQKKGYQWESWETEGERAKEQTGNYCNQF